MNTRLSLEGRLGGKGEEKRGGWEEERRRGGERREGKEKGR